MKKYVLVVLGVLLFSVPTFAQLGGGGGGPARPDIVVKSVQPSSFDEVIVLENQDERPFDLAGWTLTIGSPSNPNKQTYTFSSECVLQPGAQIRLHSGLANLFRGSDSCGAMSVDLVWSTWFALDDGVGVITISREEFVVTRHDYPHSTSSVIINEVELNPGGDEKGREWVELYNPGNQAVSLDGWSLGVATGTSIKLEIPMEGTISAGGYLLVQVGLEFLNNQGEGVELRYPDESLADQTPDAGLLDLLGDNRCWARVPNGGPGWNFQPCTMETANLM
jgi:hypothetical protein